MRSNSGKDEARNNLHDPTLRDREHRSKRQKEPVGEPSRTTGMGSGARKSGQDGDQRG